jgi:hypothetical protein
VKTPSTAHLCDRWSRARLCLLDFKTTRLGCTYIRKENRTPTIKIASSI